MARFKKMSVQQRTLYGVLRRMVGGTAGSTDETAQRRAVHDRATALFTHLPELVLHACPYTARVDRVDAVELLGGFLGGAGGRDHDPGVLNAESNRPN